MGCPEVSGARLALESRSMVRAFGGSRTAMTCPAVPEQRGFVRHRDPGSHGKTRSGAEGMAIISPSCDPGMKRDLGIEIERVWTESWWTKSWWGRGTHPAPEHG